MSVTLTPCMSVTLTPSHPHPLFPTISRLQLEAERRVVEEYNAGVDDMVRLNVGGHELTTTRSLLTSVPGSMLCALLSGRHEIRKDGTGAVFLVGPSLLSLRVREWLKHACPSRTMHASPPSLLCWWVAVFFTPQSTRYCSAHLF